MLRAYPAILGEQSLLSRVVYFEGFHDPITVRIGRYGSPEQFRRFIGGAQGVAAILIF